MHQLVKTTNPKIHKYRGWQIEKQSDDSFTVSISENFGAWEVIALDPPIETVKEAQTTIDQLVEQ